MPKNWNNDEDTIRPPKFTNQQRAQIQTLALIELHRQYNDAGWPPSAYQEMADWSNKHNLATEKYWRRFAYWRGLK
jgi:hypothetical protein